MIQSFRDHTPRIHPTAWVHPDATVIGQVSLGPRVTVWPGAVLRGDMGAIDIGADSNIQDGVVVHMTSGLSVTTVGERVTVGHRAILHGCVVANDCLVGMGSILLDNCRIPDRCIVGAGALVSGGKVFDSDTLLLGSPARVARALTERDLKWIAYSWKHYLETAVHYPSHPGGVQGS